MGIKNLNRFLKDNSASSINFTKLAKLSGKKIAVDISIYMYRFASDDNLIENTYLMLSIFRYYNIIPIFIFDGKAPPEKRELLMKRRQTKKEAEEEYKRLKVSLQNNDELDEIERQEIMCSMDGLKRKFVNVSSQDIEGVKGLIRAYGCEYYDAQGEADEICALLAIKEKVWACLSEDMDMFVYGCPRVIRYFSLLNHTAVIYEMEPILKNLGISQKELREICVLSGTDYNSLDETDKTTTLNITLKYFKKYHKEKTDIDFYDWLTVKKKNYIKNIPLLLKINDMFDMSRRNIDNLMMDNIVIETGEINKQALKDILKEDGFVFPIM